MNNEEDSNTRTVRMTVPRHGSAYLTPPTTEIRYTIMDDIPPLARSGRHHVWNLPLASLPLGKALLVEMPADEVKPRKNALRQYVARQSKKLGLSFSVIESGQGYVILHREDAEEHTIQDEF